MDLAVGPASSTATPRETLSAMGVIRLLLQLSKARITFAVTFSVTTGYVLFSGTIDGALLWPTLGTFLLACGSATLNQVQEWRTDAKMARTQDRPIPSGRITANGALTIAVLFLAAGLNVLAQVESHTLIVVGLGAFAVIYYNGVYWALKRVTAFAVVPGALIGAVPPVIGWSAAGGWWWDQAILEVAGFFFIWQIPHFWLLVQVYGEEYEEAGLPMPTRSLSPRQFRNLTSVWILAVVVTGLVLSITQGFGLPWNFMALIGSIWLAVATLVRFQRPGRFVALALFKRINIYCFGMTALIILNACV